MVTEMAKERMILGLYHGIRTRYFQPYKAEWNTKHLNTSCEKETVPEQVVQVDGRSWIQPSGYSTGIQMYNSLTRTKVPLILKQQQMITWYMCGPTVYDSAHLGHACCYVKFDIIRRILQEFFKIDVTLVMNITDIDDKIIKKSNKMNMDCNTIARWHETDFFLDMAALDVIPPTVTTRVTDYMPHIISYIQKIIDKELAYVAKDGSVYFDVKKYGHYGKLVLPSESLVSEEPASTDKRSPQDFALWKAAKPGEPWWHCPWGKGRPGWHIECSAMASHIFGKQLDLHSGGIDLLFPHHENEEAQCCAYHDVSQWANYWLHTGHLCLKDDKMSKSLQNTISIKAFLEENSDTDLRMFCLLSHYRKNMDYTGQSLDNAVKVYKIMHSFLSRADAYIKGQLNYGTINEQALTEKLANTKRKVQDALADDFATGKAIDGILNLIGYVNAELEKTPTDEVSARSPGAVAGVSVYVKHVMDVFGINFMEVASASESSGAGIILNKTLDSVLRFRSRVRNFALAADEGAISVPTMSTGNSSPQILTNDKEMQKLLLKERAPLLKACDELRNDLRDSGVEVKDHKKDSTWMLKHSRVISRQSQKSQQDQNSPPQLT